MLECKNNGKSITSSAERAGCKPPYLVSVKPDGSGNHVPTIAELFLFSGRPRGGRHEYGVRLLLSKLTRNSLVEWSPISERILTSRFTTRLTELTITQFYAPTETASREGR
jgi:hypothetical protein